MPKKTAIVKRYICDNNPKDIIYFIKAPWIGGPQQYRNLEHLISAYGWYWTLRNLHPKHNYSWNERCELVKTRMVAKLTRLFKKRGWL